MIVTSVLNYSFIELASNLICAFYPYIFSISIVLIIFVHNFIAIFVADQLWPRTCSINI